MTKKKVIMVGGTMNVGGQENQIMNVLRYADHEKYEIDYTTTLDQPYYKDEIEKLGGKCIHIPEMDWRKPWIYCKAMYRVFKNGNYDIVHSHELFHTGITLAIASKAGIPIRIAHSHSGSDGDGGKRSLARRMYNFVMRRLILRYATERIACSSIAGEFLYGKNGCRKKAYNVVFNSVETSRFLKSCENANLLNMKPDWKNVLHVGHVIPLKNQEFLVRIANVFKQQHKKIHIYCVGPGNDDYISKVNEMIHDNNLEEYISLVGIRSDVQKLMQEMDAFVLPSKYEGMPLVMIEAQASGLPCVAASTFSKEVDFGVDMIEWLELSDDVELWATAIEVAANKEHADKSIIKKAILEKGFDSSLFAEKIFRIYEKALGRD